jgi:hypothetical protein
MFLFTIRNLRMAKTSVEGAIFWVGGCLDVLEPDTARTLEDASTDPYDPGNTTFVTPLRRLFLRAQEINPHPLPGPIS